MGLIRMALSSVGSSLSDQVVEYFRCDGLDQNTLCVPATQVIRGKAVNKGTESYISSGSVFDVAINQAALLVEDGKVHDMVIATDNDTAGQYKFDSSTAPSILGSGFKDLLPSIKDIGKRFTAGGQATHTMRLVYINMRNLVNNKIGFGNVPFRDGEMNLSLNAQGHGSFEFQIYDPARFYESSVHNMAESFNTLEGDGADFIDQLKADMKPKFGIAISKLSAKKIPYDQIIAYADDLAEEMNAVLEEKWVNKGVKLTSLSVELNVDEESKKRIAKFQEARTATSDPSMLYGLDRMSINTSRETAAGNPNGAMAGFMGMGMAGGMMGQAMDPTMYNQQMQQNMANQQAQAQQAQQAAPAANGWTCSCGATATGKFCPECGNPKPSDDGWTCSCGSVNKGKFCQNCGSKKPEGAPLYKCDKCGWEPEDPKNPPKFCPECGDPFDDNDIQ